MLKLKLIDKLTLGFTAIIIFLIIFSMISINSLKTAVSFGEVALFTQGIQVQMLECRRWEKNIIIRGDLPELTKEWRYFFSTIKVVPEKLKNKGYISLGEYSQFCGAAADYGRLFEELLQEIKSKDNLTTKQLEAYDWKLKIAGRTMQSLGDRIVQNSLRQRLKIETRILTRIAAFSLFGIIFLVFLSFFIISDVRKQINEQEKAGLPKK